MFIISFSQLFLYDHSQGAVYHLFAPSSCPEVEIYGKNGDFSQ